MLLNAFIARRYLFSKKSHNAINIITAIAVMGIGVATAAMICVMSVFNGFRDLVSSLYTTFDPELVVVPTKGKFAPVDDPSSRPFVAIPPCAMPRPPFPTTPSSSFAVIRSLSQ